MQSCSHCAFLFTHAVGWPQPVAHPAAHPAHGTSSRIATLSLHTAYQHSGQNCLDIDIYFPKVGSENFQLLYAHRSVSFAVPHLVASAMCLIDAFDGGWWS